MKKLLFMSDGPWTPSGFGVVMKNLIERLKGQYDIHMLSWQYHGIKQKIDGITFHSIGRHRFGKDVLVDIMEDCKPDYLITLGDYWMCGYPAEDNFQSYLQKLGTKWIWYLPIDSDVIPNNYHRGGVLKKPNTLVTMSLHGYETAKEYGYDSIYIPHGTDTALYKPMEKKKCREHFGYKENKFIVGCVARNSDRKQLPRLIKAFSIFQKGKKDVMLHLHCDLNDPMNMVNDASSGKRYSVLSQAILNYGIEDKVRFTVGNSIMNGIDKLELPILYNMMDVHAISTSGEGFGLPIMDSLSCGIPNIMTDYTTAKEFIGNDARGIRVPVKALYFGGYGTERALVDEEKFAEALEKLYNDKKLRESMSKEARELAKANYKWNDIIKIWKNTIFV
jgi:glycosyltransferase involved in cell wall biosynthesis